MRLVKVSVPEGEGREIAEIAFRSGISSVSYANEVRIKSDHSTDKHDVVNVRAATPIARRFLERLAQSPWGRRPECVITVRQPQSIHSSAKLSELTRPMGVPQQDLRAELWQFTHVTVGFLGRVFCATVLLSQGLAEDNLLHMLGGLMFLPNLPLLMSIALGLLCRDQGLARHGLRAWLTVLAMLMVCPAVYGLVFQPVHIHQETTHWATALALSALVGVAAALADVDDTGKRELIGLAAASQLALQPAWAVLAWACGQMPAGTALARFSCVFLNAGAIVLTSCLTYWLVGVRCHQAEAKS